MHVGANVYHTMAGAVFEGELYERSANNLDGGLAGTVYLVACWQQLVYTQAHLLDMRMLGSEASTCAPVSADETGPHMAWRD